MDLHQIRQILDLVREHELSEFEIEHEGLRLKIRKDATGAHVGDRRAACARRRVRGDRASRRRSATAAIAAPRLPTRTTTEIELAVVKSPIVGTFYRSSEPGAPAFVEIGSAVKKGDVLCIIEAMKLMNEIDSEYDGEIVNIYVENGQPVQYGERSVRDADTMTMQPAMFKKILIANRGEVALRIIYACRELGIKTVAVYSEADENQLHVKFADEDVCIGPARSADSYLNVPAVISAAEITGADAIHPGYGFLSESAYLAEVCEACHIKFIGPDPQVIRLMGDKARARRVMKKAGVPILPGSDGPIDNEEKALKLAKDIGYPGHRQGDGRRRRPRHARRPRRGGTVARGQDRPARGGSGVRRRRRLHREVRRVAPPHRVPDSRRPSRQVVHLGERECSIQRRHQKLIEESPSPALSEKMRRRMGSIVDRRGQGGAVHQRRHLRVPDGSRGPLLFHGGEHPPPGRASGHRDGDRHRHRQGADPHRGGRAARHSSRARSSFTGHSIECRINAEDPGDVRPVAGADPRVQRARRPRRARRDVRAFRLHRSRRTTTR